MLSIINLMSLGLNARCEPIGNPPQTLARKTSQVADIALAPLRYLCNGRLLSNPEYRMNPYPCLSFDYYDRQIHWVALAILALVPATIIGTALRVASLLSAEIREEFRRNYRLIEALSLVPVSNRKLAPEYKNYYRDNNEFQTYLFTNRDKGAAIWDAPETIEKYDKLIKQSAVLMEKLFEEVNTLAKGDTDLMAYLLTFQNKSNHDPIFCYCYFYSSLWNLYESARNQGTYKDENRPYLVPDPNKFREVQPLFFDENTPQGKWRELYNRLNVKLDEIKSLNASETLRQCLMKCDNRASAIPDNNRLEGRMFLALVAYPTLDRPSILS